MNQKTIIFVGMSGSGKGTQSKLLKEYLNSQSSAESIKDTETIENTKAKNTESLETAYIETGSLFRDFVNNQDAIVDVNSHSVALAKNINDSGGLQPEFLAVWLWSNALIKEMNGQSKHVIIDGAPRRLSESQMLLSALNFFQRQNIKVFYLEISTEISMERLKHRNRNDDLNEQGINRRIDWFNQEVKPAIDDLEKSPNTDFHIIDGEVDIDTIHKSIINKIND